LVLLEDSKISYDSAQGILDPESTLLFFAKVTNSRAMSTLMHNLDRALEIAHGPNNNILQQILRPHAIPYEARPTLMLQWQASSTESPPDALTTIHSDATYTTPTSDRPTTPNSYAQAASSTRSGTPLQPTQLAFNKKRKTGSPHKQPHHLPQRDSPSRNNNTDSNPLFFLQQFQDTPDHNTPNNHNAIVPAPPRHMTPASRPPRDAPQQTIEAYHLQTFFNQQTAMLKSIVDGIHAIHTDNSRRFDSIERSVHQLTLDAARQEQRPPLRSHYTEPIEEEMEFDYGPRNHLPNQHD
jgi:hypothetical protein